MGQCTVAVSDWFKRLITTRHHQVGDPDPVDSIIHHNNKQHRAQQWARHHTQLRRPRLTRLRSARSPQPAAARSGQRGAQLLSYSVRGGTWDHVGPLCAGRAAQLAAAAATAARRRRRRAPPPRAARRRAPPPPPPLASASQCRCRVSSEEAEADAHAQRNVADKRHRARSNNGTAAAAVSGVAVPRGTQSHACVRVCRVVCTHTRARTHSWLAEA
jgi:hypothetical protein